MLLRTRSSCGRSVPPYDGGRRASAAPQARHRLLDAEQGREAAACLNDIGDRLDPAQRALVHDVATQLPALAPDLRMVYRHGDYSPRNWLWSPRTETLGLIDFEMADYGLAVQDLEWLHGAMWQTRPDLRDSFLAGHIELAS